MRAPPCPRSVGPVVRRRRIGGSIRGGGSDAAYDQAVRLTRHAKNRLRLLRRRAPELTEPRLLEVVVVDEANQVVVTIWREE